MHREAMQAVLQERKAAGSLRSVVCRTLSAGASGCALELNTNDYLALGQDKELQRLFVQQVLEHERPDFCSRAARLMNDTLSWHVRLEEYAGSLYGKACLYLNSGFEANSGALSALSGRHTLILADKLSHASIIDGLKAGQGKFLRFAHNDMQHLRRLLTQHAASYADVLIVTEALFSMDGDRAPLEELVALKHEFPGVQLYLDEAHSFGVYGPQGLGLAAQAGLMSEFDFILCTLGKAAGSHGALLLCDSVAREYLLNTMRPFIFSTALPPVMAAHALFMLQQLTTEQGERRRDRLRRGIQYLREAWADLSCVPAVQSQIIPVMTPGNAQAVQAAAWLKEQGLNAFAVRHPTVPAGQERVRLSLHAGLNEQELEFLALKVRELAQRVHQAGQGDRHAL